MPPLNPHPPRNAHPLLSASRRRFLQLSGAAFSGALLTNCARNIGSAESSPAASPAATGDTNSPAADNTLYIYSWSTYIDNGLLEEFEKQTGIKVIADIYDSNETMLAKLQAGGGGQYSVIYPSDYMVEEMIGLNLLTELDTSRLPSTADLFKQWQSPPYDPGNKHSIPFAWGTTGLIYNAELLNPAPTDWSYLWANKSKLSRKMTLLNDVREVMGFALKSLGYSNSTKDPKQIEAAYRKLAELKPAVNSFTTDGWKQQILVGDLALAHAYSVDAIGVIKDAKTSNPDLKLNYVVPKSGATVWTDTMAIPKSAPNVDAAYAWMTFMLENESGAKAFDTLKVATPNKKTKSLMSAELQNNPNLFPSESVLAKCEVLANLGDAADIYDKFWTQLTSA